MLEQPKANGDYLGKTAVDETMANQQVTDAELGWFAGIIDGEGCISLQHVTSSKPHARGYCLSPRFSVTNTDPAIIAKTAEILRMLGVGYYIMSRKGEKKTHREIFILRVDKFTNLKILLPRIIPYLIGEKNARARLVLEFVESRFKNGITKTGRIGNQPYRDRELEIHEILRSWNPNDHTLPAAALRRDGLDSERKPESAAEMTAPPPDQWKQKTIARG